MSRLEYNITICVQIEILPPCQLKYTFKHQFQFFDNFSFLGTSNQDKQCGHNFPRMSSTAPQIKKLWQLGHLLSFCLFVCFFIYNILYQTKHILSKIVLSFLAGSTVAATDTLRYATLSRRAPNCLDLLPIGTLCRTRTSTLFSMGF